MEGRVRFALGRRHRLQRLGRDLIDHPGRRPKSIRTPTGPILVEAKMWTKWGIALVAVAVVAMVPGCAVPAGPRRIPVPEADRAPVIIDADPHGVVFLDTAARRFVGARRDGTIAWRAPAGDHDPTAVMCLARCPDAVLSGSTASLISTDVADPEPVLMIDGRPQPLASLPGPRRWVLTARGVDDLVLHTGDGNGQWWLEVRHATRVERIPVSGPRTSWREDPTGQHGLAVSSASPKPFNPDTAGPASTASGPAHEVRWFDRDGEGWRPAGTAERVVGAVACLDPDGSRALIVGQRPILLDRTGSRAPVTDLERAGTCALTRAGGIVADLTRGTAGSRSLLRVFDASGTVSWRAETPHAVALAADPTGARVGYVAADSFVEIDPRSGAVLRTTGGVRAAGYDGAGRAVVIQTNLSVTWLDAASDGGAG
jgi:hypothetical protein